MKDKTTEILKEKPIFEKLRTLDVSKFTEKKGQFSYLSWADAVDNLLANYPTATWDVIRHNGMPYMKTELGYFVEVTVSINGLTRGEIHPVLDYKNKAVIKPDAFQINTSIKRCLAKAISMHGMGLYIYRGEDLPPDDLTDLTVAQNKLRSILKDVDNYGPKAEPFILKMSLKDINLKIEEYAKEL